MAIQLSDHFDYRRIIRFTFPSIAMMVFTSIYGMVDGYFVSNYVGSDEFAALNFIWPVTMIFASVGFMLGTGGSALVAKKLGEGERHRANRYFSMIVYFAIILGTVLTIMGLFALEPIAKLMGAEGKLLDDALKYGYIIMAAVPTFILQAALPPFIIVAERPKLGLWITVGAGLTNMVLDFLLVGLLRGGLVGAAAATVASQLVGAALPLIFFILPNGTTLRLREPSRNIRALGKACMNGMSELVTNVSLSIISIIYNVRLLEMAGADGVSSYGVIMYVAMLFLAIFFGYSMGISPVISFHFGAGNGAELKSLFCKSQVIQWIAAVAMSAAAILSARAIAEVFTGYDKNLCDMAENAFRLYAISFLLSQFNIFASSFFTALNDGVRSAVISFSRMLLFQITAIFVLPLFLGLDGIWLAMPAAELACMIVSAVFYLRNRHKFGF